MITEVRQSVLPEVKINIVMGEHRGKNHAEIWVLRLRNIIGNN